MDVVFILFFVGYHGACCRKLHDPDRCIEDLTKAISLDPNSDSYYFNRGLAFYDKGDFASALSDYTSALKINPRSFRVLFSRGSCYRQLGDLTNAIADYTAATEASPTYVLRHAHYPSWHSIGACICLTL